MIDGLSYLCSEIADFVNGKLIGNDEIIEAIIRLDQADRFIIAISELIQRFAIDTLHVIGDIYDRGPKPAKIMDLLDGIEYVKSTCDVPQVIVKK